MAAVEGPADDKAREHAHRAVQDGDGDRVMRREAEAGREDVDDRELDEPESGGGQGYGREERRRHRDEDDTGDRELEPERGEHEREAPGLGEPDEQGLRSGLWKRAERM